MAEMIIIERINIRSSIKTGCGWQRKNENFLLIWLNRQEKNLIYNSRTTRVKTIELFSIRRSATKANQAINLPGGCVKCLSRALIEGQHSALARLAKTENVHFGKIFT